MENKGKSTCNVSTIAEWSNWPDVTYILYANIYKYIYTYIYIYIIYIYIYIYVCMYINISRLTVVSHKAKEEVP